MAQDALDKLDFSHTKVSNTCSKTQVQNNDYLVRTLSFHTVLT